MKLQKSDLGRGIELDIIHTDKFKSCYYSVSFMLPLSHETAAANAMVTRVLRRGCKKYPTIAERTKVQNELYDAQILTVLRKIGEVQQIGFALDIVDDRYLPGDTNVFEETVEIMRNMLFEPLTDSSGEAFCADIVEKEKINLIDDVRAKINNKVVYASHRLTVEMCGNEAYGASVTGDEQSIAALDASSIYRRYKEIIKSAPVRVFFVGNTEGLDVKGVTERLFGGIERACGDIPHTEVVRSAENVKYVEEEQPSSQGKLCLGFRMGCVMGEKEYAAALLMNEIFGGSPKSKLFANVREKLSLCYYCQSRYETLKGILTVSSGIDNANRDAAEKEILAQLASVAAGDISEEELEAAKGAVINSLKESYDSALAQDSFYCGRYLCGISQTPDELIQNINSVESDDISRVAQKVTLDTVYFMSGSGNGMEDDYDED